MMESVDRMELTDRLLDELMAEAKADEVGLWFIIAALREEYGVKDTAQRRLLTLSLVQRLLDSGQVVAGYYHPDGSGAIIPWKMSTVEVLSRIISEWDSLGRDPSIGEVVVFVSPPTDG
jgi:hypothetical protein